MHRLLTVWGFPVSNGELEDLSFRYLNPTEFYKITHMMKEKRREREALVDEVVTKLEDYTTDRHLKGKIYGRPKHIYSIFRKMQDKRKRFEEIYDLIAIRCILDTQSDVYAMLGYVHELWKPMPGRFKDYIANRKANGYQSIHTTVYGPKGPIEFQIRTKAMHEVAEYGVAAHWAYKKGIKGQVNSKESAIGMNWIKEMMELQDQADDAKEFVDSVKENYLAEEIYVFTPDGAVRSLPKDSGPIDFAYEIHTKVGEKATGAKVNGRMVPLTTKLKTGDQVEIVTNPNSFGPSRDWLNMVKTSKARNKIRQFFKNQDKELSVNKGREMLMAQFQENGYVANKFMDKRHMDQVLQKTSYKTEESLFAAIGFGEIGAITVFNRLTEKERREEERAKAKAEAEELVKGGEVKVENKETLKVKHEGGVVIEGASGLLVRIAKCCNPVPGDDIVGYITKGRGVAIHRVDCMNLRAQENYEQRLLDVEWEDQYSSSNKEYMAHIDIYGLNRTGLLNDVLQVLSNTTKNISTVNAQPTKDMKFANIHVSLALLTFQRWLRLWTRLRVCQKSILSNGQTANCPTSTRKAIMKIIIQRVKKAQVSIEGQIHGKINQGLLLLVGVGPEDQEEDLDLCCEKACQHADFSDAEGKMNLSVKDIEGEILSISQFTLFADTKKGNRPAFTGAAKPDMASDFYDAFNQKLAQEVPVQTGIFGADMQVELVNDGPVTIILDTKNR